VQPAAEPPGDNEITVVANKLRAWRGNSKLRDGVVTCKTNRSTRDKAIDAVGCDALIQCMTPLIPQWQAINDADLPRKEAEQRFNALLSEGGVHDCTFKAREAGIAALVAARRSKRS
jgi:hypothetical protein